MTHAPRLFLALGLLTAAVSCGEEEEPSIDGLIDDIIAENNGQIDLICGDCADEFGFASKSECDDFFGYIGPSRERCIDEAFKRDEAVSREYLECVKPVNEEYTTCIKDRLDCNEVTSIGPCDSDAEVGIEQCVELPNTVENALDDCWDDERSAAVPWKRF